MASSYLLKDVIKKSVAEWLKMPSQMGASALSFFTIFSLTPLLIFTLTIALRTTAIGLPLPDNKQVVQQLSEMVGGGQGKPVRTFLKTAMAGDRGKATAYGFLFLLIGASSVFVHLQRTLDLIWNREKPNRGAIRHFMHSRAMSIGWVIFLVLLIISFFISQVLLNVITQYGRTLIEIPVLWRFAHFMLSFTVLSALFAFIFRHMSGQRLNNAQSIRGGAITAVLFIAARALIRYYFQVRPMAVIYGPAAWAIIIPIWVYLQWQVFLFGAHLTWQWSEIDEEKETA